MEIFRGVVGMDKVEVGCYGQHANLNLTVLSCNEGFKILPVFRRCVQDSSHHGDFTEKGAPDSSLAAFAFILTSSF